MRIRQQLVASRQNIGSGTNSRRSITVHETGNTGRGANASAHANLQSRPNPRLASWHWTVDDREAVQSFLHTARTFHAGRAEGNNTSISIEICVNSDGDYVQTVKNAAALVARIMRQEGLPISAVRQHNSWSGKNCPTGIRAGRGGMNWAVFLTLVAGGDSVGVIVPPPIGGGIVVPPSVSNDLLWQLQLTGWYDGTLDGVYGPMAKAGVKAFQAATGLFVDGVVGPLTTARLQKEYDMSVDRIIAAINAKPTGISEERVHAIVRHELMNFQLAGSSDTVAKRIEQIFTKLERHDAQYVLFNIEGEEGDCVAIWGTGTWMKAPNADVMKRFLDVAGIWMRLKEDWNLVIVDWRKRVGNPEAEVFEPLAFGAEVPWTRLLPEPIEDEVVVLPIAEQVEADLRKRDRSIR